MSTELMKPMKKNEYELRVCFFDKENMLCYIGKRSFKVKENKRQVTWTEKEDAGGGCYWSKSSVKMKGFVTDLR